MDEALHDYDGGIGSWVLERPRKVVLRVMPGMKQDSLVHGVVNSCPRQVLLGRNRFPWSFATRSRYSRFFSPCFQWGRGIGGSSGVARFLDNLTILPLLSTLVNHTKTIYGAEPVVFCMISRDSGMQCSGFVILVWCEKAKCRLVLPNYMVGFRRTLRTSLSSSGRSRPALLHRLREIPIFTSCPPGNPLFCTKSQILQHSS